MKARKASCRVARRWAFVAGVLLAGVGRAQEPPDIPPLPLPLPPQVKVAAPGPKAGTPAEEPKDGKDAEKKGDKGPPPWTPWQPPGRAVTLAECLAVARVRQPAVQAAQLSLAASERGYLALQNFRPAYDLLSPDLPFRRRQAERGLAAMTATVQKAIQESVYDTTRVYFEYVRATQQEQTAADIVEQMEVFYRVAEDLLNTGVVDPKKLNKFTLYALEELIDEVKQLRSKASNGRVLAVAALTQAMGLDAGERVYPADAKLPVMGGHVTEDQVVQFALAARPELVQVAVLVDVTRLEVCAQGAARGSKVDTFASGSDLHSQMLPAAIRNGEYRPGAVPPEMPPSLAGKRDDRVARAALYSARMDEVYRATVALVRLEAVNAFLHWKATSERLEEAHKRFERGKKLAEESRTAAATKQDPELLVKNEALAGKAQAAYVEAVYEHLKALLTLERVTAGQVRAGFPTR